VYVQVQSFRLRWRFGQSAMGVCFLEFRATRVPCLIDD